MFIPSSPVKGSIHSFIHEDLGYENKQTVPLANEDGLMHSILNFKMLAREFDEHAWFSTSSVFSVTLYKNKTYKLCT